MSTELTVLPKSCIVTRQGLTLKPGLTREEWLSIGTKVGDLAGATSWVLGDFLAYGDQFYLDAKGAKRIPDGLYAEIATRTGFAEQTLRNLKYVCAALPLSRRRDKLTFSHAIEIVSRVSDEKQREQWIDRVVEEGMSSKALREQIRKSQATHKEEPNDVGVSSFLETTRQYVRDFQAESSAFTPAYRQELLKILAPVLRDLG